MRFGYPKSARLRRRDEFDRVFREGKMAHGRYVRMLYVEVPCDISRIGVAVGKRTGKSWARNRGRRLLKEAARRLLPWLRGGCWIVFLLSPSGLTQRAQEIYLDMANLCSREGLLVADWPGIDFTPWAKEDKNDEKDK